eukprot:CAMPEP_0168423450 /NCGR_PEP_ID=MMETSP0228-20121227/34315_1 /TAXON_ID=133427 /ORGANISM="Protoceratium reticulatum, Strain CCCM 535 (=CCMP 1889)" /LENGTH=690 /DNA_ID=CAMNT_0008437413 /DNA_START=13 /DNA_END=2082 /DNA_ORIENTATION=+
MADLIGTVDQDEGDAEASGDEEGPQLAKKGRFRFSDLISDEEEEVKDPGAGGWNFGAEVANAEGADGWQERGLEAKIKQRLQEKREEEGEEAPEPPAEPEPRPAKKRKLKDAKRPARQEDTLGHLNTGMHFAELRLSKPLLRAVAELKFETPTPIQRDVIPPALRGLDVLATAETGSGKTASFLLPILERLCQSPTVRARKRGPDGRLIVLHPATKAMVLIPTRELAVQCHAMLKDLAKYTSVTHQLVAGGFLAQDQAQSLRAQPDIVIATPGRLLDHLLNSASVHLELLEIVIFDEADRLLELGFKEECNQVLQRCSKGRQTMLFSATMNSSVEDLANLALVKPVRVHANPVNRVAETLEQEFVKCPSEELREAVLLSLCERNYTTNVIIFCATKQAAHRLAIVFGLCGWRFAEIHGNLAQAERVQALKRFQNEEVDFLLATDLAARGLDLVNVETVVNFHLPVDHSRYIHRVGRTARMGRVGKAVTIYSPEEYARVKMLGKQCCSKVKSTVLKRTVAPAAMELWAKKVQAMDNDIEVIGTEESLEREVRLADMLAGKSDNLQKYRKEINSRPAKQWYMSNRDKAEQKADEVHKIQKMTEAAAQGPPEPVKRDAKGKKRKQMETPEQKRQRRAKEKFIRDKENKKAEKIHDENRIRASARRAKKKERPVKGEPIKKAFKKKGGKGKGGK